jgi:uncharacterized protein (DUF1684 family)
MSDLTEFRRSKDEFFREDHHSPLTKDQQAVFRGLHYYEESQEMNYRIQAKRFERDEVVDLQTSSGSIASYLRWGSISFGLDGTTVELVIFRDGQSGNFFLPFADATSGTETYGAGRYLDVKMQASGHLLVDFNYSYNPYCAYNEHWSCPLTPAENRLSVALRAGEKSFDMHKG